MGLPCRPRRGRDSQDAAAGFPAIHEYPTPFFCLQRRQELLAAQMRVCSALSRTAELRLFQGLRLVCVAGSDVRGRVLFGPGCFDLALPRLSLRGFLYFSCQFAKTLPGLASNSIWDVLPATKSQSMYFETSCFRPAKQEGAWLCGWRHSGLPRAAELVLLPPVSEGGLDVRSSPKHPSALAGRGHFSSHRLFPSAVAAAAGQARSVRERSWPRRE